MAALTTIAAIAAATTAGVVQSRNAQKDARKQAGEMQDVQSRREAELEGKRKSDEASRSQRMARERQRLKAGAFGMRDTILTSPLGLKGGGTQYQGKTLLGS